MAAVLAGIASPALACPRDTVCLTTHVVGATGVRVYGELPRPRPLRLTLTIPSELALPVDPLGLRAPVAVSTAAVGEMPGVWQTLRREVYARMPRYEQEQGFSLMLSPVVVPGLSDTVPGFGFAGKF